MGMQNRNFEAVLSSKLVSLCRARVNIVYALVVWMYCIFLWNLFCQYVVTHDIFWPQINVQVLHNNFPSFQPRGFGPMWWSPVSCTSSPSLPPVWLVRQMPSRMMRMHRSAFCLLAGKGLNAWTVSQHHWWNLATFSAGIGRSRVGKVWKFETLI